MSSFSNMSLEQFIAQAASDAPTPGGGGIAALAGALGAAMASMAANFTVGKAKYAEHDALMRRTLAALEPLIRDLRLSVDADADAFSGIAAAYKLPRDTDADKTARKQAIHDALTASMAVPLGVAAKCVETAWLLPELAAAGNPNLLSDVEVAAVMLEAAAKAAQINVLANSSQLDGADARQAETAAETAVATVARLAAETLAKTASRRQ